MIWNFIKNHIIPIVVVVLIVFSLTLPFYLKMHATLDHKKSDPIEIKQYEIELQIVSSTVKLFSYPI